jgi:hypothetical protein
MSIFPVKIKEWFYDPESPFYDQKSFMANELKNKNLKCHKCGKNVTKKGYVMHSIFFGGPDEAWCSKKCMEK